MKLSSNCIACLVNGCAESIKDRTDEENKSLYMRDILRAILAAPDDQTSPCFHDAFRTVYEKYFGTYPEKDYTEINRSDRKSVV